MVLVVDVVGQVVLDRAVRALETAHDVTQSRECGRTLRLLGVLDAEIGHDDLLQRFVGAGHEHRERWLVVVRDAAGQSARAL